MEAVIVSCSTKGCETTEEGYGFLRILNGEAKMMGCKLGYDWKTSVCAGEK